MSKLRKHLDATVTISVQGEEDGRMEVSFNIQAKEPYSFIIEGIEFGFNEAIKQYKEQVKLNEVGNQ